MLKLLPPIPEKILQKRKRRLRNSLPFLPPTVKATGIITKTYGFNGAVVVRSEGGLIRIPGLGEPVFVIIDGIPVPFFTREASSPSPDTLIISFDDYLTAESVDRLRGCEIQTGDEAKEQNDLTMLTGYRLVDKNSTFSGVISTVTENTGQLLALVIAAGEEIFIPLHPDLIIAVDEKEKTIEMSLPAGLTSLNN
jgi:16S rRNA processing protein RimM